jgi:uncharacterized protein YqgC (DUF456 family)
MPEWAITTITIVTFVFILAGFLGLILPIYPGIVIIWLATLGYGIATGFNTVGIIIFVILTLLMVVGSLLDNVLMTAFTHKTGASWWSIILALVAGLIGTLAFPPIGGLIAVPLVLYLLEWGRLQDHQQAFQSLKGLVTGWGLSYVARLGIGLVMVLLWGIWVWRG